jgi:mannose/fructose/N-acetylgalactosamine-specific phosphotransferase system component IID
MANIVAVVMGVIFILVGLAGFVFNNLLGAHLTLVHNLIHLVSGIASLYFGLKGSPSAARLFCLIFGFVYLSLAVIGYWFGYDHGASYLPPDASDHGLNENMFRMIPGVFELGTMDHIIHIVIAAVYLLGGVLTRTRRNVTEYLEGNPG